MAASRVAASVIVPCYCSAGTIDRAVRSAMGQTMPPLEVIIVDDASTDRTAATLVELQQEFGAERLRIVTLAENRGPSAARNAGWEVARGEYVAFLDADDAWHPRKLEIQLGFMQQYPGFALTGHRHAIGAPFNPLPEGAPYTEIRPRDLLLGNRFVTPSVIVRRNLGQRFRDGQRHMEDHLLWMQISLAGHRIARIELELTMLFKPQFGGSGQSAELWAMERAEIKNYALLRRNGLIGAVRFGALVLWSLAKFARRLAIICGRRYRRARNLRTLER